jgi:adenosylhomocysteinase
MRAQGLGAQVIVTEVKPVRALEAVMDGFRVMPIVEAAKIGDVFVTITGDINVIGKAALAVMKDGAILANSGHFDVEINLPALKAMAKSQRQIRPFVEEYALKDGRRLYLLAEGRVVNLSAAEGHPAAVMDMSFANQALGLEHLVKNKGKLKTAVYPVPEAIDRQVARLKLKSMEINIDTLTPEQEKYLSSWEQGT